MGFAHLLLAFIISYYSFCRAPANTSSDACSSRMWVIPILFHCRPGNGREDFQQLADKLGLLSTHGETYGHPIGAVWAQRLARYARSYTGPLGWSFFAMVTSRR